MTPSAIYCCTLELECSLRRQHEPFLACWNLSSFLWLLRSQKERGCLVADDSYIWSIITCSKYVPVAKIVYSPKRSRVGEHFTRLSVVQYLFDYEIMIYQLRYYSTKITNKNTENHKQSETMNSKKECTKTSITCSPPFLFPTENFNLT